MTESSPQCPKFCDPCLEQIAFQDPAEIKKMHDLAMQPQLLPTDEELWKTHQTKVVPLWQYVLTLAVAHYLLMFNKACTRFLERQRLSDSENDTSAASAGFIGSLNVTTETVSFSAKPAIEDNTFSATLLADPGVLAIVAVYAHCFVYNWKLFAAYCYSNRYCWGSFVTCARATGSLTDVAVLIVEVAIPAFLAVLTAKLAADNVASNAVPWLGAASVWISAVFYAVPTVWFRRRVRAWLIYYCSEARPELRAASTSKLTTQ